MHVRSLFGGLVLAGVVASLTSCTNDPSLTSIAVNPGTVSTSMSAGLQIDFTAIGSYTRPGHTAVTKDITNQVTWASSWPQFVSVNSTGVATVTGYGYGVGSIYASAPGFHGDIVGSSAFTIQNPNNTSGSITKLLIYPAAQSATSPASTVQFVAVGKTAEGETVKLTSEPTWISTDNMVASIDKNAGVVTKLGVGRTTIVAVYTNADGTTAVGKTTFNITGAN